MFGVNASDMSNHSEFDFEEYEAWLLNYESNEWEEVKNNPPKPPWIAYPDHDRYDIFWRMGIGEDHVSRLSIYLKNIEESDYVKYKTRFPEPSDWDGWYSH